MKSLSVEQKAIIAESLEELANNLKGLLVFFCTDNSMDRNISKEIAERCRCETRLVTVKYSPTEFAGIMGSMDLVISMPLHSAIIATSDYTPVIAIEYNPKVRNFMRFINLEECVLPIERLDSLKAKAMEIWLKRAAIHDHLKKEIGRLQEKSIAHLQRMLGNKYKRKNPRNIPLLIFSLIYMGSAFIPEYLIHKYLMK